MAALAVAACSAASDVDTITKLEIKLDGKSLYPVKVEQVGVVGDFASLSWQNGESGGMSAFHRINGAWTRCTHGGGAFDAAYLVQVCAMPLDVAKKLAPG